MKIKAESLTDAALDWAVAKCIVGNAMSRLRVRNGRPDLLWDGGEPNGPRLPTDYSTNQERGGTIIDRHNIGTWKDGLPCNDWIAQFGRKPRHYHGPTRLIAAMRCYVANKLGEEIEVPDELC